MKKFLPTKWLHRSLGCICAALGVASTTTQLEAAQQPGLAWDGPYVETTGWLNAGANFLGWIWVDTDGQANWHYNLAIGDFLYLPPSYVTATGAWAYTRTFENLEVQPSQTDPNWGISAALDAWVYTEATLSTNRRWIYIFNGAGSTPLRPSSISVQTDAFADFSEDEPSARFANAIHLSPEYLARFADLDPDVDMEMTAEGVKFTSTVQNWESDRNRYIRLGYYNGAGYLDFDGLEGISGRAAAALVADVDLTETNNGFYVRMKQGDTDIAAYERLGAGALSEDIVLEPYFTNAQDNTYIEITLPAQSSVTIKDAYLYMEDSVRGFAEMASMITGGEGATAGNTHTVTNASQFRTALNAVAATDGPSIIYVDGTISYEDWVNATGDDAREAQLGSSHSNTSIIGVGSNALFDGVGLALQGSNIIVQNVTVRYVLGRDAIQINNGTYVWIDHCTLYNEPFDINPDKDKFDELISAKNNAHSIIISWNHIRDSHKTILVGSNDTEDAIPDRKMIFHHNWFENGGSRHPLYRGGHAHIYNNYYLNIDNGINVRTNAKILIENNYFEDSDSVIGHYFGGVPGLWEVSGNIYNNTRGGTLTEQDSTVSIDFAGDYNYTLDPTADVPAIVTAGAGVGKIGNVK
jgi:pectate lyase